MRGIRRTLGTAARKKAPATAERIISMALGTGNGLKAIRDRALLLLGFAGAFRRFELVALDCEDIEECETGIKIAIRQTDQEGQGATIGIVRGSIACPVAAVQAWRDAARITAGPLFLSIRKGGKLGARLTDQSVAEIVKANAERVGLDPALFAGHSLRAGFLTSVCQAWRLDFQNDGREPPRSIPCAAMSVMLKYSRTMPGRACFNRTRVSLHPATTSHCLADCGRRRFDFISCTW